MPQINPIMVANDAPVPHFVVYSSVNPSYVVARAPWRVFDGILGDYWQSANEGGKSWLGIYLGKAEICDRYTVMCDSLSHAPTSWSFEGSRDGQNWEVIDTQSNVSWSAVGELKQFPVSNTKPYLYYRINVMSVVGNAHVSIRQFYLYRDADIFTEYGTATSYYVDQQNGNDNNDGLTPSTAWATLNKAVITVKPKLNDTVFVYIAPGIYRESLSFTGSELPDDKVVFYGDSECLYFTDGRPGAVIISGYNADEQTPIGITFVSYGSVILKNIEIHSPYEGVVGPYLENCKIWAGLNGIIGSPYIKNCEVYAGNCGLIGVPAATNLAYNCIVFGRIGFQYATCYHCYSMANNIAFSSCSSYNCAAQYSMTGFSSGSCYNCIASNCQNGFTSTAGSNRKSIGCSANTGDSAGSAFYFLPEIKTLVNNGLLNKGVPVINNPTDIIGLERNTGNGLPDIGPIENCDYSLNYDDFYISAPSVQINRSGQLSFTFRVNEESTVIKQITVKHFNTANDLKPQVIIRGLGIELIKTASCESNEWEQLTVSFISPANGVMEMILSARDPNPNAYCLFSNIL